MNTHPLDRRACLWFNSYTADRWKDKLPVRELLLRIQGGTWATDIAGVRAINDKAKRDERKKKLNAITWSGEFSHRNNDSLTQHSGIIAIDLDNVAGVTAKKESLKQDPHVLAAFISPSGTGLKALVHVQPVPKDDAQHKQAVQAVKAQYDCEAYDDLKDVSRLCYVSHDPDLYLNPDALPIEVAYTVQPTTETNTQIRAEGDTIKDGSQYQAAQVIVGSLVAHGFTANHAKAAAHAVLGQYGEAIRDSSLIDKLAEDIAAKGYNPSHHYSAFVANVVKGIARPEDLAEYTPRIVLEVGGDGFLSSPDTLDIPDTLDTADKLVLSDAPAISETVYASLPGLMQEACSHFKQSHERDVFLTGGLASLSSCMPSVRGYYGHNAELLAPNLYVAIIAGAAGGKGVLRWAERLIKLVDEHIRDENARERAEWAERKEYAKEMDEPFSDPEPPKKSLLLPGNASAAAFHQGLANRWGRCLVIETEIDTMVNALAQEWGKFDDTLRKSFHHERVSYLRKSEEVSIEDPCVSLALSGTQEQMRSLIPSSENGLYSRIALLYFEGKPTWLDQRPTSEAQERVASFETLASRVKAMYQTLEGRQGALLIEMEQEHWDQHRDTFAPMLKSLYAQAIGHFDDIVKRAGVIAFRIAMILRVLRSLDLEEDLSRAVRLRVTADDMNAALWLACTYADHALRFARTLAHQPDTDPRAARISRLLPVLRDEFSNEDVYTTAQQLNLGMSDRTLRRDLEYAAGLDLIQRLEKSMWRKL